VAARRPPHPSGDTGLAAQAAGQHWFPFGCAQGDSLAYQATRKLDRPGEPRFEFGAMAYVPDHGRSTLATRHRCDKTTFMLSTPITTAAASAGPAISTVGHGRHDLVQAR
jgi:hypothetical protein